ncbi:hypothetical protein [Sansalvadorimonas verongulae]|uniref:hypothetical protein n=1 Tax=Sansalvadorimonas verongulae TaxID=2172824 RepID=UPI0012BC69A6|nr:hypothetical protein [Sansalvadorimonas verongulae]MTI14578.1 hypothetical protein [Sansalvadorimonas verongulae]
MESSKRYSSMESTGRSDSRESLDSESKSIPGQVGRFYIAGPEVRLSDEQVHASPLRRRERRFSDWSTPKTVPVQRMLSQPGEAYHSTRLRQYTSSEELSTQSAEDSSGLLQPPFSLAGSGTPSSFGSIASLQDELAIDRRTLEEKVKALGKTVTSENYLCQCGLLIKFLVDADMHETRKRILSALDTKGRPERRSLFSSAASGSSTSRLTDDEKLLKQLLELSKQHKVKRNPKTHKINKEDIARKQAIIRAAVSEHFPALHHFPSVSKNLWTKEAVQARASQTLCLSEEDMGKKMQSLSAMFRYLVAPYGISSDELTTPSCDFMPDFVMPHCPWDKQDGDYYIPFKATLTVDGEPIAIPQECYKELANSLFIRMQEGKAFALSGRENWDKLSSKAQKALTSELNNDENSLCSDAYRFDCVIQRCVAPELPLLPVFSSAAFLQDYQKTVQDKAKVLLRDRQGDGFPASVRGKKGESEPTPEMKQAVQDVRKNYLETDATGQHLVAVLTHVLGKSDRLVQLVTGGVTQGALNELYMSATDHLFPRCDIAVRPTEKHRSGAAQTSKGHLEINDWGDGRVELFSRLHFDHFKGSDNEPEKYQGDSFFSIRMHAVCDGEDVTLTHVELGIDIHRTLTKKQRDYLSANKKRLVKATADKVQAIKDIDKARAEDPEKTDQARKVDDKFMSAANAQNLHIATLIKKEPESIGRYISDPEEQRSVLAVLDSIKAYDEEHKKIDAIKKAVQSCGSVVRFGFGICRRLPEYLCEYRSDQDGMDLALEEGDSRLIHTQKDGWVITNIGQGRTHSVEMNPAMFEKFKSRDDLLNVDIVPTDDEKLSDRESHPAPEEALIDSRALVRYSRTMRMRKRKKLLCNIPVTKNAQRCLSTALGLPQKTKMLQIMDQLRAVIIADVDDFEWEGQIRDYCAGAKVSEKEADSVVEYARLYYAKYPAVPPKWDESCPEQLPVSDARPLKRDLGGGSMPHLAEETDQGGRGLTRRRRASEDNRSMFNTLRLLRRERGVVSEKHPDRKKELLAVTEQVPLSSIPDRPTSRSAPLMPSKRLSLGETGNLLKYLTEAGGNEKQVVSEFSAHINKVMIDMTVAGAQQTKREHYVIEQRRKLEEALDGALPGQADRVATLLTLFDQTTCDARRIDLV